MSRVRGGPRREFFDLLLLDIFKKTSLFAGFPMNIVPVHNIQAVTNNTYYVIGKMIATCGGEVPACFAQAIADVLVNDRVLSQVCLEDIPDYEVRDNLKKVCTNISTLEL